MASGSGNSGLRVVVVGATGNVGTAVVEALGEDPAVDSVLGLARRVPRWSPPKTRWAGVDIARVPEEALVDHFRGADAVIHLAWLFQPTHEPVITWRTNVLGSTRVFDAVVRAGVGTLVHASSVGAYSPGPKDRAVDEGWPTHGWPDAAYCREKAYLERVLDSLERDHPDLRVVRMRPGFIFQHGSAPQQRRLFAGPLVPHTLVRPGTVPAVPDIPGLRFQVLHARDAAEAYRLAVVRPVRGAFNLAAEPVVDPRLLSELLRARRVPLAAGPVRLALSAFWRLHLVPASPHLFEAVLRLPLMDTRRAREELGWSPRYSSREALGEFLAGLRARTGLPTPPLAPRLPGGRAQEVMTGVGRRP
ncbi:NAD-dependent epimerase [Streptomyces sulfonofaciens]|uniref:NAD-dependent epimerase n=1 Tax=Streptomyces sulfonofaciens TaxID=68272 RepID=A0A919L8B8_9ACTN|nr:NAD-dependent epimerase/dehydratase family protein [Streptomyces sulfonofaciens]GHH87643.1 NAD-dependent epimerase [Streptomyces sulfonofaciens]